MNEDGHWVKEPFLRLDEKGSVIERIEETVAQGTCGDCKWWMEQGPRTKDIDDQSTIIGWCKRLPHTEIDKDKDDWCGEFEPRENR